MDGIQAISSSVTIFPQGGFCSCFCLGLYGILYLIFDRLTRVNPGIGAAIVAGMLALFGVLFTQRQTKVREIAETHREHKAEIYDPLFDIIELMAATKDQADYIENSILVRRSRYRQESLLAVSLSGVA